MSDCLTLLLVYSVVRQEGRNAPTKKDYYYYSLVTGAGFEPTRQLPIQLPCLISSLITENIVFSVCSNQKTHQSYQTYQKC